MTDRSRILRRLDVQAAIEGETQEIRDCRVVLAHCRTSDEWSALTTVGHHRYGPLSYEAHVFYGLRPWVRDMCRELLTSE